MVHYLKSQIYFKYNNYKNYIINNKSDKSKILNLRMAARQWRVCLLQISTAQVFICVCIYKNLFLGKHATDSDVFIQRRH
jgi:hypothetical protein